jgi:hypothetical protein
MLVVNEHSFNPVNAHSPSAAVVETAMHAPAAPTTVALPPVADTTVLSPEQVLLLELGGLSSREIRRLLFARWPRAAGRLGS